MRLPDTETLQDMTRAVLVEQDPSAVQVTLRELLDVYEILNFDVGYKWPLWRARIAASDRGYSNVQDIHYPPAHLVTAGRMNSPGEPVLYLSFNKYSTFAEIDAGQGDFVHLAGFRLQRDERIKCAMVGEVFNVHRSGRATLCDSLTSELNRILVNSDYHAARSWVFLDAFFAKILSDPHASESEYVHSRTAAKLILEKMPNVDAIWYPGVALENGVNLAIRSESADTLLSVYASLVVRVDRILDYGIYDFSIIRHTDQVDSDGVILWKESG